MKSNSDLDLPSGLEGLLDLALDLRWTERQTTDKIWEQLDSETWEKTKNPYLILQNASRSRLAEAAKDADLKEAIRSWREKRERHLKDAGWFGRNSERSSIRSIAYFSMEFGLSEALPIYSGGLGILAGDHLKTASDLGVPITGVGLLYQQGYFRQVLSQDGSQIEAFPYNDPATLPIVPVRDRDGGKLRVQINLPGRSLILRVWQANVCRVNLYLLDSNDPMNSPWDRAITANLYAPGQERRLIQEIVLGIGGWQALEMMGIEPDVCHLNEGHAAFVILARAYSFMLKNGCSPSVALWATRAGNAFTTHTPVEAGFDRFDQDLIRKYASYYADQAGFSSDDLLSMGTRTPEDQNCPFTMPLLALRGSSHVNGVSRLHGLVSKRIFQVHYPRWPEEEVPVGYVTNGVHIPTWDSPAANQIWAKACPDECGPDDADAARTGILKLGDSDLWCFRAKARKDLVDYVRKRHIHQLQEHGASPEVLKNARHVLNPNFLTLGFARRANAYKRTDFLLRDSQRLIRILTNPERPVQLVMAAKAHLADYVGKEMVKRMANFALLPEVFDRVVFLEDYDIDLAQHLQPGVDVWINTPRRPNEACGTSGMKVLANGGLNLSSLDGWWDEACTPEVGWCLGDDKEHGDPAWDEKEADQLYRLLEDEIIPKFYDRDEKGIPKRWIAMVRSSMATLTPHYSSMRMMREYVENVYQPASDAFHRRIADNAKLARELAEWKERLNEGWNAVRFGRAAVSKEDQSWHFRVEAYLGDLASGDVRMELYANAPQDIGPDAGKQEAGRLESGQQEPVLVVMDRKEPLAGAVNGFIFEANVPATRPAEDYTPRIVPYHPQAFIPLEDAHILWQR